MKKKLILFCLAVLISSCSYVDKNIERKIYFRGIITNKFFDAKNHGSATFSIKTKNETFLWMATIYPNSWECANIGDSIIKEKGELYLTIKRQNGDSKMFPYWQ